MTTSRPSLNHTYFCWYFWFFIEMRRVLLRRVSWSVKPLCLSLSTLLGTLPTSESVTPHDWHQIFCEVEVPLRNITCANIHLDVIRDNDDAVSLLEPMQGDLSVLQWPWMLLSGCRFRHLGSASDGWLTRDPLLLAPTDVPFDFLVWTFITGMDQPPLNFLRWFLSYEPIWWRITWYMWSDLISLPHPYLHCLRFPSCWLVWRRCGGSLLFRRWGCMFEIRL